MSYLGNRLQQHGSKIASHLFDHVVPHSGNEHHPHLLKHRVLFGYSVLLVLLKLVAVVAPIALPSSSLYSSAITPSNVVDLTNQTRQNLNASELKVSSALTEAAQAKAEDMLNNQYFAHTSPAGVTPWSWMAKAGYAYQYAGENLAINFTSSEGVQEGWMASPSHRANIVNPRYSEIGIGVLTGQFEGHESTIVVQMFGQPVGANDTSTTLALATTTPKPVVRPAAKPIVPAVSKPLEPKPVAKPTSTTPKPSSETPNPKPLDTTPPPSVALVPEVPAVPQTEGASQSAPPLVIPVIDETSLKVVPGEGYYTVSIDVTSARSVAVHLGDQWVTLGQQSGTSMWTGRLSYDVISMGEHGEQLSAVAWGSDGTSVSQGLVWLAPAVKTQQMYTFNEGSDKYVKLFGLITIHNLNDSVRKFYVVFVMFLAAALLINVLVKIRIQKLSVINHTMMVMALALLMVIL